MHEGMDGKSNSAGWRPSSIGRIITPRRLRTVDIDGRDSGCCFQHASKSSQRPSVITRLIFPESRGREGRWPCAIFIIACIAFNS
jgi:hypothetical protein